MWLIKLGVPALAILGFGHAVYEVLTGDYLVSLPLSKSLGDGLFKYWAGAAAAAQTAYCIWL
jgi:hypothetical protein